MHTQTLGIGMGTRVEDWHSLLQVFSRLDGRNLAIASCVSKTWSDVAFQPDLWKQICHSKWPSLDSNAGQSIVKQAGGYRSFFARRYHARHAPLTESKPWLSMQNLIFLVDVTFGSAVICSFIRQGFQLAGEEETFRFTVNLSDTEGRAQVFSSVETVKDCKVSWAVMVAGSPRVSQVMDSRKPGQLVGDTCNFSEALTEHGCCPPGMNQHLAEVRLALQTTLEGRLVLRDVCLSFMNTLTWRYFSHEDALRYLQQAFSEALLI